MLLAPGNNEPMGTEARDPTAPPWMSRALPPPREELDIPSGKNCTRRWVCGCICLSLTSAGVRVSIQLCSCPTAAGQLPTGLHWWPVPVSQGAVFNPFPSEGGSLLLHPQAFPDSKPQDVFLLPFHSALGQEGSGEARAKGCWGF